MNKPFHGSCAVVTGASSGIGRAIAIELARAGVDRMLVHYRQNDEGARKTLEEVDALGCQGSIVAADLSIAADRCHLVETAFASLGSIQTWVNNAGADVLTGRATSLDFEAKLRRLLEVDVIGTFDLSRRIAQRMMAQPATKPPSIVFLGWDQSPYGMEGDAGQMFGAVKAAVMAFAASMAQDVAPKIRVNTVAPGWIQTQWGKSTGSYWNDRAQQQSLMHRWGRPADVARAVLYVADPGNTFITGQTIEVNGGWNRRFPESKD